MADNLTTEQRTKCMSNIRNKWTGQEKKIHSYLKSHKIKHKMHPNLEGSPDILLKDIDTVLFLHGCFWHKCSKCYKEPKSNKEYWLPKIERNIKRDRNNAGLLRRHGFKVKKMWEHEIKKDINKVVKKIICFHP